MSYSIHKQPELENKFPIGITGLKQDYLCDKKSIFKARFHHLVGLGVVTSVLGLYVQWSTSDFTHQVPESGHPA